MVWYTSKRHQIRWRGRTCSSMTIASVRPTAQNVLYMACKIQLAKVVNDKPIFHCANVISILSGMARAGACKHASKNLNLSRKPSKAGAEQQYLCMMDF